MELKTIIIDDDLMCRRSLEIFCGKHHAINLIGTFESAAEYLLYVQKEDAELPDLLFLDVEMPELTGIQLLDAMPVHPLVILNTAKKEYAYEAFEYQVTDFLKKPTNYPRFAQSVEKALQQFELTQKVSENTSLTSTDKDFFIKVEGKFIRLNVDDVLYFESTGDYVTVKTTTGSYIILSTMKSLDEKLTHPDFIKVHRSYIINKTKIVDIEENTIVIAKKVIPISRANKAAFLEKLSLL